MKKFNIFSLLALLTLSVFLVGCGEKAEIEKEKPEAQGQVQSIDNSGEESAVDTSDWQTYRNEELGFEIKYPEDQFEISFKASLPSPRVQFSRKNDDCDQNNSSVSQMDCVLNNKLGLDKSEKSFDEFLDNLEKDKNFEFEVEEFKTSTGIVAKKIIGKSIQDENSYMDNFYLFGNNSNYYIAYFYEEGDDSLRKAIVSTFKELN